MARPLGRIPLLLALGFTSLLALSGCLDDVCELDMTVSTSFVRAVQWRDAQCSLAPDYESDYPAITIEHAEGTLEIYTFGSTFEAGSEPANAAYTEPDGSRWQLGDCTLDLVEAKREPWTKTDHWILEGQLDCVHYPLEGIQLSNVEFSIYAAAE